METKVKKNKESEGGGGEVNPKGENPLQKPSNGIREETPG